MLQQLIITCPGRFIIHILIHLEATHKIFLVGANLKSYLETKSYHEKNMMLDMIFWITSEISRDRLTGKLFKSRCT